jgi:Ca-activated chloride channel family protein
MYCLASCICSTAQYYIRGEVRNEHGVLLEGVKLKLKSKPQQFFTSGSSGAFGISLSQLKDSLSLQLDGYEKLCVLADSRQFQRLQLNTLPGTLKLYKNNRASIVSNAKNDAYLPYSKQGESYSGLIENNFIEASSFPETGFSLNIDNAAYSNVRRFISNKMFVPEDAVRIEEMLNYFSLPIPENSSAENKKTFRFSYKHTSCPWNQQNHLLFLQMEAPAIPLENVPPSNLVFLIDISGSMDKPNRLPLLQSAFKLLVNNLRDCDTITIATYGGGVGIVLPPTGGAHKQNIKNAIDSLSAGGDTPGAGAIQLAYQLAKDNFIPQGNNRVILATDGDFNVGQSSEKELEELIQRYQQTGIYLTCLGVGMGNYKDSKLESLSKKGNGNFAYIDQAREAEKVLVKEFTKTMFAVADDASVTVRFNPSVVSDYRLIGFDNKKAALEDSNSVLEGGEIGSGHTITAIFEISPAKDSATAVQQTLASLELRYKKPGTNDLLRQSFTTTFQGVDIERADSVYRFAAAVAMFGSVLRKSKYTKDYQLEDVLTLARSGIQKSNVLQNEFGKLLERAILLYNPSKKKRK